MKTISLIMRLANQTGGGKQKVSKGNHQAIRKQNVALSQVVQVRFKSCGFNGERQEAGTCNCGGQGNCHWKTHNS